MRRQVGRTIEIMVAKLVRWRFLLALLGTGMPVVGYMLGDNYHAFQVAFVIIPVIDRLLGTDPSNPVAIEMGRIEEDPLFSGHTLCVCAYPPRPDRLVRLGDRARSRVSHRPGLNPHARAGSDRGLCRHTPIAKPGPLGDWYHAEQSPTPGSFQRD